MQLQFFSHKYKRFEGVHTNQHSLEFRRASVKGLIRGGSASTCSYSCVVTCSALGYTNSMHGSVFHIYGIPQQTDCVSLLVSSMNLTNHGVR